ncbi:DUF4064 domain-containing protein [Salinicoccus sp. RF5]|uniref:DUF4064 domain-containing protein n=1 Tax=Salinicoccus sp. RF5 TaxID=2748874 RepID=UPI001E34D494|nr:DUF4064 domain-containing protein [Salinicoccus sp. RF5]MCC4722178.1 DUF4064 domain-containing protein [Salinicoccus sp. RF5]
MARKNYTQTVEPVSRIAEKIFGWLAWLGLLAITALLLFFSLVTMNDPAFVDDVRQQLETEFQNVAQQGQDLGAAPGEVANMVVGWLNNVWMLALYLAIPLILGLFGLLTMRRRILAGFLLLIAGILTAPMIAFVITGLIPLFFVIAAILLFVRKDRVITHDDDMEPLEGRRDADARRRDGVQEDRRRASDDDAAYDRRRDMERDLEDNQVNRRGDDPVGRYEDDRQKQRYADEIDERERTGDDDLERTRTFRSLDDNGRDGRSGVVASDAQSDREGEYVGRDDDRYVDRNIDSQEATEPVTEEEYARRGGIGAERDDVERNTRNGNLADRSGDDYGYDATRERRDNVNRRNNDTL